MVTYYATRAESDRPPAALSVPGDAYVDEVSGQGRVPTQVLEVRVVAASADIAVRLWIEEGASVVLRRCWRRVDARPWSIQDSYYPSDIVDSANLLQPSDISEGTIHRMAMAGHSEVGYRDEVTARLGTADETQWLDLGRGAAVLVYVRTAVTNARPVRVTMTTFAANRNRLIYEVGDMTAHRQSDR